MFYLFWRFALFLASCYPGILVSHLQEYLLLPAVCELGLDCTKGYKMQSALARLTAQIGVPKLQATSYLTLGNIRSSLKCCSFAWCEYREGKSLIIWEALRNQSACPVKRPREH